MNGARARRAGPFLAFFAFFALFLPGVFACSLVPTLGESPEDYQLYRNVHLAETWEARLASARRYLHEVPDGRRRAELERWFAREEAAYYAGADGNLPRLRAYLAALPDGPHAADAIEKVRGIEVMRRQAARYAEQQAQEFADTQAHLQRAAEGRQVVLSSLRRWMERVGAVRSFGQPLAALPSETTFALRVTEPRAVCAADACRKRLELPFEVPNPAGELVPRSARLQVSFEIAADKLTRARLHGPELWARAGEALSLRAAPALDALETQRSLALAAAFVEGALGERFAAPGCEREPKPGVPFERACDGVHVTMRVSTDPNLDDSLDVEPLSPVPAVPKRTRKPALSP